MATKKTAPKKASKPAKKSAPAKQVSSAKKAVNTKSAVKKTVKSKPAPKKAAPVKKVVPAKKAAPVKKAPAKAAPPKKVAPIKKSPAKAAPVKKAAVKKAPEKKAVVVKKTAPVKKEAVKSAPVNKAVPAKSAKPAAQSLVNNKQKTPAAKSAPVKAAPTKAAPAGKSSVKKPPVIAPEIRFAQTSKAPASATEIRKALRAKENKKDLKPVAMPKITTKTARKYEPEFTKSVLDAKAVVESTGPTQRYSDAELQEFRELIQNKLNAAKQELAYLNGLITRKDSMSGEDNDSRYMTMEDGSLSMEREQLSQMASRQIDFIEKLEKAMMRIENKTYGICRVTGKLIDKARLRAVPHATLSMEAKMGMNKPGSGF